MLVALYLWKYDTDRQDRGRARSPPCHFSPCLSLGTHALSSSNEQLHGLWQAKSPIRGDRLGYLSPAWAGWRPPRSDRHVTTCPQHSLPPTTASALHSRHTLESQDTTIGPLLKHKPAHSRPDAQHPRTAGRTRNEPEPFGSRAGARHDPSCPPPRRHFSSTAHPN